jgi:prepilin-type N-terminal cleavage/methylation domain-containing protein
MKLNKKGFTLIELLVVVAIIAILAGIVLVSLNSAKTKTRKASLQSTLSSIIPTANMCVNDGGSVQDPTANTTGGGAICDLADITETWPSLAHITGVTYQYITTGDATVSAGEGTTVVVSCDVASGSCTLQ